MTSLSSQQNQNAAPSLGDIARKARVSEKSTSKRVFTDDDVMHSVNVSSSASVDSSSTVDQAETTLHTAEAYANSLADKTERQLSDMEVGDVQFPGRDRWEPKLFAQKEALVKTIRTAVYAAREYVTFIRAKEGSGALSKDDQLRLQESRKAVQSQIDDIRLARFHFDQLVSEGVREAAEWKRTINR